MYHDDMTMMMAMVMMIVMMMMMMVVVVVMLMLMLMLMVTTMIAVVIVIAIVLPVTATEARMAGTRGGSESMDRGRKWGIFHGDDTPKSGWWFGTMDFYDFSYVGNNNPN